MDKDVDGIQVMEEHGDGTQVINIKDIQYKVIIQNIEELTDMVGDPEKRAVKIGFKLVDDESINFQEVDYDQDDYSTRKNGNKKKKQVIATKMVVIKLNKKNETLLPTIKKNLEKKIQNYEDFRLSKPVISSHSDYNLLLDHYYSQKNRKYLLVKSHYNDKVIRHVSREKQRIKIARNSIKKNIDQYILRSYKREIAELKLLQNENKIRSWKDNICHHCAACSDPLIHQHLKMPDCRRFFEPKQFVTIDKHNSRRANCDGSAASNILIIGEMGQAYPGIDLDCYSPSYHNTKLSS
ncbi:hypothetical protein ACTFIZ_001073 [Dictyostelium cf. discoideum]